MCHNTSTHMLKDESCSFSLAKMSCLLFYQVWSFCLEKNSVGFLISLKLSHEFHFSSCLYYKRTEKSKEIETPQRLKSDAYSKAVDTCAGPNLLFCGTRLHFCFPLQIWCPLSQYLHYYVLEITTIFSTFHMEQAVTSLAAQQDDQNDILSKNLFNPRSF